jgi:hypothetical protein
VEGAVDKTDDGCFIEFVIRPTLMIPNEEQLERSVSRKPMRGAGCRVP